MNNGHVAAAAGVTKPVLYRYVSDKSDLAGALAERYAQRLLELLEEGTTQPTTRATPWPARSTPT